MPMLRNGLLVLVGLTLIVLLRTAASASDEASASGSVQLKEPSEGYYATLNQGIDFTKPGYPRFIIGVTGMSSHEKTHRWTDANVASKAIFKFDRPLPSRFALELKAWAFARSAQDLTTIRLGNIDKQVRIGTKPRTITLWFENIPQWDTIEIIPANPDSPANYMPGKRADTRKLGIALVSLKIRHGLLFEWVTKLNQTANDVVGWCQNLYYRKKYQAMMKDMGLPPVLPGTQ